MAALLMYADSTTKKQIAYYCITRDFPVLERIQGWTGHIRRWDFSHEAPLVIMKRKFFAVTQRFQNFWFRNTLTNEMFFL
jgi:hypothetical protein